MAPNLSLTSKLDAKHQAPAPAWAVQDIATGFVKASKAIFLEAASVLRKALHFCSANAIF